MSNNKETINGELYEHHNINVDKHQALLRIDKFLIDKIPGTSRISFAYYNTKQEIDYFITSLKKAIKMLS